MGVGLPRLSPQQELLREYFEKNLGGEGFHYAYTYPGMNRIMQAVGRLIRTDTDRGAALLVDDRFASPVYRRLYPPEWSGIEMIREPQALAGRLSRFRQSVGAQDESCSRPV